MFNKTFSVPRHQQERPASPPHRDLQTTFLCWNHHRSNSRCQSPDSISNISYTDVIGASNFPGISKLECNTGQCSPVNGLCNNTVTVGDISVAANMNQTFIATPVSDGMNFWNKTVSLVSDEDGESGQFIFFSEHPEETSASPVTASESLKRHTQLSSCETSFRGYFKKDDCSLRSKEIMRNNDFSLEDQSLLAVSSLDESPISSAAGHLELPIESNLLSNSLLDVGGKSTASVTGENTGHPCLGITFMQTEYKEYHTEENDMAASSCLKALPSENEKPLSVTFIFSGGAIPKQAQFRAPLLKPKLISASRKTTGTPLTTVCKPAASATKKPSTCSLTPLKRTTSSRLAQTLSGPVDKNKSKASACQQRSRQPASQQSRINGPQDVVPASATKTEQGNQKLQQLEELKASNRKVEAVAIVLQQTSAERDEATRQCRALSQELVSLRGELVSTAQSSERLEKEKQELQVSLEGALQKLQEKHQSDLAELKQRLQAFYQAEWDKVHLAYQEEADKCKTFMQQQINELKATHEAMKLELERGHSEQLQSVKQEHEMSLEELSKVHNEELQSLGKALKDSEAALSCRVQELTGENNALNEKLRAEENRRKALAENSQKDPHTLYMEQELESLKAVLDIKNQQLHQQEKKLIELDKLMEKFVKLDESLTKVQQENEDLKARMEKHAALSRQLSSEQVMLQESLQKESRVNKRLSMENEELLWKLHNGDLSSPRKVSPTSTSPSFTLQSPRSSTALSSPPVSPR
ncbi:microtubule-associated tumor suppressor 1 homolog A [Pholidichthys leucotaenia]